MAWRRWIAIVDGAVLCGLLAACGSGGPPAVFHPAGRFLFASVGKALEVYTFGPEGSLTRVESLPSAGRRMAVTFPPP